MSTLQLICEFIADSTKKLIRRRDIIGFGTVEAVDAAIYKLTSSGSLVRLGWGIYAKKEHADEVTLMEVVEEKAKAFGRVLIESAEHAAYKVGLTDRPGPALVFLTNGRSSSFRIGSHEVILKGTSPRKMALGDSLPGQVIRGLWHLGEKVVDSAIIGTVTSSFSIEQRIEIGRRCSLMPGWLSDYFFAWNFLDKIKRSEPTTYIEEQRWTVNEKPAVYQYVEKVLPLGSRSRVVFLH